jgi:class 3 adenylate cyclase
MGVCPSCQRELPGQFPFCPFCGESTAPQGAAREERKVVSVLFVDLVGFTARAERLDPEDVRSLLGPYHAHVREELERFGGTVEKFIGDAVMALFGAPTAHEDDPERAVRAALAIRDWADEQGDELQVRIAVNTGEALVTLDARPGEGEGMAAGDVVNAAARLQTAAPLNGVLVGEQTYRATADVFDYRVAEPVVAKGKAEPLRAWEALAPRARFGVDLTRGTSTPLVGRVRELDLLVSTLERVRAERSPQLVTLVGVPGIGKSRLVHELFRSVDEDEPLVTWRQGRSLPYGDGVTFWALAEIVKAQAGILESDSAEQTARKLRDAVVRVTSDPAETQWLERQLRPLAGLPEEGGSSPDEAFAAWRRFLELLAEQRPLVCVFEDLHWADDSMLDFIDRLVDRTGGVPLFVLGTARPELLQRRAGWGGGKPNALTISLSPLSDEDAARLVANVLDRRLLEADTQATLLERAGGNPLYAEQYARALNEGGVLVELPETVQGIIAARLDALPADEKRLLQDAAVVGKVFWLGAVEQIDGVTRWQAEELLHALERKEFVQRAHTSSVGSESEYAFRHVLIRDVAYGQIPRAVRSEKHQRVAGWIESLGRSDDQAELLAHHYLQALELAEATGLDAAGLSESARHALRDAGDRAASLYAIDAAERFYDAALRLWPEDDPQYPYLLYRRAAPIAGLAIAVSDPERLAEAAAALLEAGDREKAAEAESLVGRAYWFKGRPDLLEERLRRASELLEDVPPSRATVAVLIASATRAMLVGDSVSALEQATRARLLADELDWEEGSTSALQTCGSARVTLGDAGGLDDLQAAIDSARAAGALSVLARAYNSLSVAHVELGDLRAASEARSVAAGIGGQISSAENRWYQGIMTEDHYRMGHWDEALALSDAFLADVDAGAEHYMTGQAAIVGALIRLARGDDQGAFAAAGRAVAHARTIDDPQVVYYLLPLGAYVFSVLGEQARALEYAGEFLDGLRRRVQLQFATITLPTFAAAARRLELDGDLVDALAGHRADRWVETARAYAGGDFTRAADLLHEIGSLPDEAEARLRAAEQLSHAGRDGDARTQLGQAIAFYRSVRAMRYEDECRVLLAAAG